MQNKKYPTFAVIDSGIGGMSVLKNIIKKNYGGNYIYFADNLYMPYGCLKKQFLQNRLNDIFDLLLNKMKVDFLVVACNTASSCVECANNNIFKLYFKENKTYFATPLTKRNNKNLDIIEDATLAKIIDKYYLNKDKLNYYIKRHCKKLINLNNKEIVLACTHFELAKNNFETLLPNIKFVGNSAEMIEKLPEYNFNGEVNVTFMLSRSSFEYKQKLIKILNEP